MLQNIAEACRAASGLSKIQTCEVPYLSLWHRSFLRQCEDVYLPRKSALLLKLSVQTIFIELAHNYTLPFRN
jgi:hypothetical protein